MQIAKTLSLRLRILLAFASVAGLLFIMQRIQAKALVATFDSIHWTWVMLALAAFGSLFVPAGARWRVALQASGTAVGIGAAGCISLIGHFFYTVFFGAVGGDTAKSILYSRWHRVPLTKTLAASSLDRLLGFAGLVLFVGTTLAVGIGDGGFSRLGSASLRWPLWSLVGIVGAGGAIAFWLKRSSANSFQRQFAGTLGGSIKTLSKRPMKFLTGVVCGVLVQAALSAVLVCSLAAVSSKPVPWLAMAWTFPVITIISALPVTFAGLGVRDSAAVVLFGFYNIPASHAVAASLLAAAVSLVWAAVGAGLLWFEASRKEPSTQLREVFAAVPR